MNLFNTYLEEINNNVIVVYPGRFAPFHNGHLYAYNELVEKFGKENVYILTKDYKGEESEKNPFSFEEKKKMISLAGVPKEKIIKLQGSAFNSKHIAKSLKKNIDNKILIVVNSDKGEDADRIPIGGKYYYAARWPIKNPLTAKDKGYIYIIKSKNNISASDIRKAIGKNKIESQKQKLPEAVFNYLKTR